MRHSSAEYNRQWNLANKERFAEYRKRWKNKYNNSPEGRPKYLARRKLDNAIYDGHIIKPDQCSKCGIVLPKARIHGHHTDYNKPLEVVWVCDPCHRELEKHRPAPPPASLRAEEEK